MRAVALLLMLTACGGTPFTASFGDDASDEERVPDGNALDSGGAESDGHTAGDAYDDSFQHNDASETDSPNEAAGNDAAADSPEEPPPACLGSSCLNPPNTCCNGAYCKSPGYTCEACLPLGHSCITSDQCCSGSCQFDSCN
jgi:hypothetical protein